MRRRALLALALLASAALGCRSRGSGAAPGSASVAAQPSAAPSAQVLAASADPTRLPEDPEAGRKSTEQWREHLRHEEHERRANFDRRRMPDHRWVVAALEKARARYDKATTKPALLAAQKAMAADATRIRERIQKIDKWGNNSKVLSDYEALLQALDGPYPEALLTALDGDAAKARTERATFDQHLKTIETWLEEAAESEDE